MKPSVTCRYCSTEVPRGRGVTCPACGWERRPGHGALPKARSEENRVELDVRRRLLRAAKQGDPRAVRLLATGWKLWVAPAP